MAPVLFFLVASLFNVCFKMNLDFFYFVQFLSIKDQTQPDLSGRIYDEPAEMTSSKNVYDVPVVPDQAK